MGDERDGLQRWPGGFADNEAGSAPAVRPQFDEWADPDDRHTAVVLEPHRTREGRMLRVGDVITPRQARAERVRHRVVNERRVEGRK